MLVAGQLMLDDAPGRVRIAPGFVRVDGERIVDVVEGDIPSSADVGGAGTLIAPGFIDAHLHLPQFDMIGAHGLPLLKWLEEVTFPSEMRWSDVTYARGMTERAIDQLLSMGTTGVCAYATIHHESAAAALDLASSRGLRGVIGQVLMDRQAPAELCRPAAQLLDESRQLIERFPPGERMSAAVTPRFAVACSRPLLAGAATLAAEHDAIVQSHLAETRGECDLVRQLFDGQSYVEVYREAGLLGSRSVFGHGIHLDDPERTMLSNTRSIIAHCPTANSFLRSGTMNLARLRADQVDVTLGSDIGAGYERSMVRVARAMIETAALVGGEIPNAAQAWHAITAGNADRLGWADAGRLVAGAAADLVVIEPTVDWLSPGVDRLGRLMFSWDDRWLRRTLLRGRWVWP